jgi:hypothetical protein
MIQIRVHVIFISKEIDIRRRQIVFLKGWYGQKCLVE